MSGSFFFTESTPRAVIVDSVREVIDELRKDILEGRRSQVGTKETLMTEICSPHYRQEEKEPAAGYQCNRGGAAHQPGKGKSVGQGLREHHGRGQKLYQSGIRCEARLQRSRHDHVEKILTKITGAEAAMVVNNNAAATMLCLSALARTRKSLSPGGSWWKSEVPSGCRKSWNRAAPG